MKTIFETITKDDISVMNVYFDGELIDSMRIDSVFDMDENKKKMFRYMKGNVYFAEKINMRVKIRHINDSGKCIVFCKDGKYRKAYIGDLKKVY